MALTKTDLGNIQKMINDGITQAIEKLVLPAFSTFDVRLDRFEDRLDRIEEDLGEVKTEVRSLSGRLDEHIVTTNERFDETIELIGYYFEKCATKEDLQKLTGRVEVLELKAGV